jgi:hypothetical protein
MYRTSRDFARYRQRTLDPGYASIAAPYQSLESRTPGRVKK